MSFSLAYLQAKIIPSIPRTTNPPRTRTASAYFNVLIKMRAESEKYIPILDMSVPAPYVDDVKLHQANYLDIMLYKNLNYKIFNLSSA